MRDSDVDPFEAAAEAAEWLREATGRASYDAVLVLGSGWAPAIGSWGEPFARVLTGDVPHFLAPVAEGHHGEILGFDLTGVGVLVLSGRTHLYEGHGPGPVAHPIRTAAAAGCRTAILTNANGSFRTDWAAGRSLKAQGDRRRATSSQSCSQLLALLPARKTGQVETTRPTPSTARVPLFDAATGVRVPEDRQPGRLAAAAD